MHIIVDVHTQKLSLYDNDRLVRNFPVSTALCGMGEQFNSWQTPRGWHQIRAKIGEGAAINTIFHGRRPTGEIYTPQMQSIYPQRDWILTRILWLSGLEVGKNRLGKVDTMRRYIYIHGAPDAVPMGVPKSRGCIRMHNADIIELFNMISVGDRVLIQDGDA